MTHSWGACPHVWCPHCPPFRPASKKRPFGAVYYLRRKLPRALAGRLDRSRLLLSLRTWNRAHARSLGAVLDAHGGAIGHAGSHFPDTGAARWDVAPKLVRPGPHAQSIAGEPALGMGGLHGGQGLAKAVEGELQVRRRGGRGMVRRADGVEQLGEAITIRPARRHRVDEGF